MTQHTPFPIPPANFWDGNQFVIPGYTPGYDLPPVPVPPAPLPPVLPPILPPIFSPGGFNRFGYGGPGRSFGLLDMNFIQR